MLVYIGWRRTYSLSVPVMMLVSCLIRVEGLKCTFAHIDGVCWRLCCVGLLLQDFEITCRVLDLPSLLTFFPRLAYLGPLRPTDTPEFNRPPSNLTQSDNA